MAFLGRPKPVEVFHRDRWRIGALLGWRHDADGTCWLRVSALVDGYRRTAWVGSTRSGCPSRPRGPPTTQRLLRHGDRPAAAVAATSPPAARLRPPRARHPAGARRPLTARQAGRMLITRDRTTTRTPREITDCSAIRPLLRRVNGSVSVGLKATTLVNATYR